jgi:hypothetical protein
VTRFGDPATGKDLGISLGANFGNAPYGIAKFCGAASGYQPLPFAVKDQIDYSKNNSATLIYWRPSTKVLTIYSCFFFNFIKSKCEMKKSQQTHSMLKKNSMQKFYTRSIFNLADSLCAGGPSDTSACIDDDMGTDSCKVGAFFDFITKN